MLSFFALGGCAINFNIDRVPFPFNREVTLCSAVSGNTNTKSPCFGLIRNDWEINGQALDVSNYHIC